MDIFIVYIEVNQIYRDRKIIRAKQNHCFNAPILFTLKHSDCIHCEYSIIYSP